MYRLKAALVLVLMVPGFAFAQRHGRADALQNYYPKTPNPILNIDYQSKKTWTYPRLSDLLKMKRAAVSVPDPKTNRTNLYEGTVLTQFVPDISHYRVDVFRASSFRDKLAVSSADLDMGSDVIVVDTVNRSEEHTSELQ